MQADDGFAGGGGREIDLRVGLGIYASEDQLDRLLSVARYTEIDAGEVLYSKGTPVRALFQLLKGELEIRDLDKPARRLQHGTAGFLDLMLGHTHTQTAVARTPARLIALDASAYRDYLEDNFDVGYRLMSRLSEEVMAELVTRPDAGSWLAAPVDPASAWFMSRNIPFIERLLILSRVNALRTASAQALADLAQSAAELRFAPGERIATMGERSSSVMLLVEGAIQLELPAGVRVVRGGCTFVGHIDELAASPRVASAVASAPAVVLRIERDDLLDLLEEHFDLAMALFAFIVRERVLLNNASASAGIEITSEWG